MIFIKCPYISFYIYYIFNLLLNESAHLQKIKEEKTSSHSNYVIKVFRFVCNLMPWGESCRNGQHTKRPLQGTGILNETSALL